MGYVVPDVSFSLGPGGIQNFNTLDAQDWKGSTIPNFGDPRKFGWPWLDGVIQTHPTTGGNANLNLQYAVPTFPIAEPPVLTFSTFQTIAVPKGAWTPFSIRITARFSRLQVVDVSGVANGTIYLVAFIRGA